MLHFRQRRPAAGRWWPVSCIVAAVHDRRLDHSGVDAHPGDPGCRLGLDHRPGESPHATRGRVAICRPPMATLV